MLPNSQLPAFRSVSATPYPMSEYSETFEKVSVLKSLGLDSKIPGHGLGLDNYIIQSININNHELIKTVFIKMNCTGN